MAPTIPIDFAGQKEPKNLSISKVGFADVMGKTKKVSKSYSLFVPDYRHAVETVADSEVAASEDSSALRRKSTKLNVDDYDTFGVAMRIFSLSSMSQLERRDLEVRLKSELEQVRMLLRKIDSLTFVPSETHNYQNGSNRTVIVENLTSVTDVAMVRGSKKYSGRNGPRNKSGPLTARKTETVKQDLYQSNDFVMLMKQCETLLSRLMAHQHAWIFNKPVDIVEHNVPDYYNVIKHPMDFGTIKKKLLSGQYSNPMGFAADVRLTFNNAITYNPAGHIVHTMAGTMSKYFEPRWKPIEKKFLATADESITPKSSVIIEPEGTNVPPTKKQKTSSVENKVKQELYKRRMSDLEKQNLGARLEASWSELPDNIIDFVKVSTMNGRQISEDEIEIDIDTLSDDTLFSIQKLLDDYLLGKEKSQVKVERCGIQIQEESNLSHLSVQHCKDNEPADEDVNIGGDEQRPISGSISEENDKDAARKNSNSDSSSGSSSESGSSSSDSDSGSSAVELDVVKNSDQAATVNVQESGPIMEHKERDGCDRNSEELLPSAEQNALSNSSTVDPNCRQEGDSGLPDRQASPEKLYRAALLRSRFADIIIKAQEKSIEKGERPDPEKLKLEKEELERRRREEKARLQAEAKVAEDARRKAEEEAAAEAKRKRKLEREAARQALQNMEKTVDINENSQFIEDLEMFKAAPDENLQSFIEEGIPENSENGLGSFKFPATSNPLEQLGLYMKNEDEEEEVEPQKSPDTMEKTGDINENSQSIENLEMFKAAPDDFVEEGNPENSQNGLGSIKFPVTGKPLEQLGLYMKNEDEEEEEEEDEEVEPQKSPDTVSDVQGPPID